jgi:hypothetical protein
LEWDDHNGYSSSGATLNNLDKSMRKEQYAPVDDVDNTNTRAHGPDVILGRTSVIVMLPTIILSDELGGGAI